MNTKRILKIAALLIVIIFLSAAMPGSAYYMVIDVIQEKAGAVFFPHHRHLAPPEQQGVGFACAECHHELNKPENQGKQPSPCVSGQCHPANEEAAEKSGKVYIKTAFHNLCKKCHQSKRTGYPKAPTNCPGCHKKELTTFTRERRLENIPEY